MFETSKIKRSTSASSATYIRYTKCTTRSGAAESEVVLDIKTNRKRGIILSRARQASFRRILKSKSGCTCIGFKVSIVRNFKSMNIFVVICSDCLIPKR